MSVIWKAEVLLSAGTTAIPGCVVAVGRTRRTPPGQVSVWYQPMETVQVLVRVVATGEEYHGRYLGTVCDRGDELVWHVIEERA